MNYASWFVCLMGMGIVFFGLVCLVFLTEAMGRAVVALGRRTGEKPAPQAVREVRKEVRKMEKSALIPVITAVLAAATDTDAADIRIRTIKEIKDEKV